jgi:poly-gamma-glutamate capsule biosynthesis protein CapA/YwtB (metallophosphatase superfamily)
MQRQLYSNPRTGAMALINPNLEAVLCAHATEMGAPGLAERLAEVNAVDTTATQEGRALALHHDVAKAARQGATAATATALAATAIDRIDRVYDLLEIVISIITLPPAAKE